MHLYMFNHQMPDDQNGDKRDQKGQQQKTEEKRQTDTKRDRGSDRIVCENVYLVQLNLPFQEKCRE